MHFDIFRDDAFSLSQLTHAINDIPHQPGRLGTLGYFTERGISSLSVSIEKVGLKLALVPSRARGSGAANTPDRPRRELRSLNIIHLPQEDVVQADEVQNLRAFGSETEVQTVQTLVRDRLDAMKRNIDVTMEWQRMGAMKGQIVDADGTSVLMDLYSEFGQVQETIAFDLDVDTTKVKQKCIDLARACEATLDGIPMSGVRVFCSPEFFDAFVNHPKVEAAYDRYLDGAFKRESQRKTGFWFADTYFEEYRGTVGGHRFIAAGEAYAVPEGVPGLFTTNYGPADYLETVNTIGLPYYARQRENERKTGIILESQSNPLHLCTRPAAVKKLLIT